MGEFTNTTFINIAGFIALMIMTLTSIVLLYLKL